MSAAESTGLSLRSVNSIYLKIRARIAEFCELESPLQGIIRGHVESSTHINPIESF